MSYIKLKNSIRKLTFRMKQNFQKLIFPGIPVFENPEKAEEIALNAQNAYKETLSERGLKLLTERMVKFIET